MIINIFSPRKTFYCIYSIRTTNILIDCSCRIDKPNTSSIIMGATIVSRNFYLIILNMNNSQGYRNGQWAINSI